MGSGSRGEEYRGYDLGAGVNKHAERLGVSGKTKAFG